MLTSALLALAAVVSQAPADARQINLGAPQPVVSIDLGKVKGAPARLAWSPDGTDLYLQMVERDGAGRIKSSTQYLVSIAKKTMKAIDNEPDWVAKYWTWKSAQASPGASGFKIDVQQKQEQVRATAMPTGGALAKGAVTDPTAGTTASDVAGASLQNQVQNVYALHVKGESIGEWINEAVVPGVNFGWAPAPAALLAYTKRTGGPILVLDEQGHKHELAGPKDATVPAFSGDGARLAWVERVDRKKLDVMLADISK